MLILPYLENAQLYKQYRFDEPWDGPHNRKLSDKMPSVYRCPSYVHDHEHEGGDTDDVSHLTHYVVVRGPGTLFPGAKSRKIADVKDGTFQTLMVAEHVGKPVHWMSPDDVTPAEFLRAMRNAEERANHRGVTHLALADGSVRAVSHEIGERTLKALLTIAGRDAIGDDF